MTIYTPGYEPAHHVIENGEPFNASIPLLPSNRRYFSLLENAKAKFISDGKSVHLESTGAPAGRGSSFVIFDPDAGRDVKLSVIEANPLYVKFKTNDGVEFSYPVTPEEYGKTERIDTPYIRQQPASTHREQGQFRSGLTDEVRQQTPYMY